MVRNAKKKNEVTILQKISKSNYLFNVELLLILIAFLPFFQTNKILKESDF